MAEVLVLMRAASNASREEREELWRAYVRATRALAEYARLLTRGEVPQPVALLAADAAAAAYEYFIALALKGKAEGKSEREAIAEALTKLNEQLLLALAVRQAIREEKGE